MAYFSNGIDGNRLDVQCGECPYGQSFCPIWGVQHDYNYIQCDEKEKNLKNALNILIDEKGICQMFELIKEVKR